MPSGSWIDASRHRASKSRMASVAWNHYLMIPSTRNLKKGHYPLRCHYFTQTLNPAQRDPLTSAKVMLSSPILPNSIRNHTPHNSPMTPRTIQLALSQQIRIIPPHQLLGFPISPIKECRSINFMPRQKVMFPCLGIQEIRFGGLPE